MWRGLLCLPRGSHLSTAFLCTCRFLPSQSLAVSQLEKSQSTLPSTLQRIQEQTSDVTTPQVPQLQEHSSEEDVGDTTSREAHRGVTMCSADTVPPKQRQAGRCFWRWVARCWGVTALAHVEPIFRGGDGQSCSGCSPCLLRHGPLLDAARGPLCARGSN